MGSYIITMEDGTEALLHYGVKGMKWKQHLKAQDPGYLQSLGMNVPNAPTQGGVEFNPFQKAANAIGDVLGQAGKRADEAKFKLGALYRYAKNPGYKTRGIATSTAGDVKSYHEKMANGRKRKWVERHDRQPDSSRKSEYPQTKSKASERISNTRGKTVDGEYAREKAYNTKKNNYPRNAGNDADLARKWNKSRARIATEAVKRGTEHPVKATANVVDYAVYNAKQLKSSSSKPQGKTVDGEYAREKAYNTKKNDYRSSSAKLPPAERKAGGHFTVQNGKTVYVRN